MNQENPNTIGFACIGMGHRLRHLMTLLSKQAHITFLGGYDPDDRMASAALKVAGGKRYPTIQAVLDDQQVKWIFVGSPNAFHREQVEAAFAAGKHVFCEKPIAIKREDALAIVKAHQKTNLTFATGFVLRYASIYRRVKELLDSGTLGKIVSIDANENIPPEHGAYIMTNWRRHRQLSGSHILEKCVHDLDLLNWFVGSLPLHVAAFGGNTMWTKENEGCMQEQTYNAWYTREGTFCDVSNPFTSEKDIEDHVVSILSYANGVKVQFQATMSNPIPERRMYFSCTQGTLVVELYAGTIRYKIAGQAEVLENFKGNGHGNGDEIMTQEMAETMKWGTAPKASGLEGLQSAVVGIAIDEARNSSQVIALKEVWQSLGIK